MNARLFIAILVSVTLVSHELALAGEGTGRLKMKSVPAAWIMGLDPVPADALLYAGKSTQGAINALIGIPGALLFFFSLAEWLSPVEYESDVGHGIAYFGMVFGGLMYFPALIWDAVGGISGVYAHNEYVKNHSWLTEHNVRPTLVVTDKTVLAGLQWSF